MKYSLFIRKNGIILIFLFLWIPVICLCGALSPTAASQESPPSSKPPFTLDIGSGEQISLWYNGVDTFYAFLPSYARLDQIRLLSNGTSTILLNGQAAENQEFQLDTPYLIEQLPEEESIQDQYLIFLRSQSLPALHVDVRSGNMHYIHQLKGNEEPGSMRLFGSDGTTLYSGNLKSVKGRGNATWEEPKKPYTLELNIAANLLDMGSAEKWILLPNCLDPSNLRNKFIYDYAAQLDMPYTPECRWVDLYLNGEYAGLYLLAEKNEVHTQRVDIPNDSGFLVSREKPDRIERGDRSYFVTQSGAPIRIHHSMNPTVLQDQFQSLENAIMSPDGTDPITGRHWLDMIDLDSWVQKYLIEEISGNLDAGAISQYFYSDGSGKILAGPIWDYDMSCGNLHTWQIDTPNMLYAGRPHLWSFEDPSAWYYHLFQKEEFRQRLKELYTETFRPVLLNALDDIAQVQKKTLPASAVMNQIRWESPDPSVEADRFLDYMHQRIQFLDSIWLEDIPYHTVEVWLNYHILACYAVADGETIPAKAVPDGTDTIVYENWLNAQDDSLFNFSQPITEDVQIYLKETNLNAVSVGSLPGGSLSNIIKYVPVTVLSLLFLGVFLWDSLRSRSQNQNTEKHTHTVGVTTYE